MEVISDSLPFGGLWYVETSDAIDYAKHRNRSQRAAIRVYDEAGKMLDTHEQTEKFTKP